jgi:hypothetical protein
MQAKTHVQYDVALMHQPVQYKLTEAYPVRLSHTKASVLDSHANHKSLQHEHEQQLRGQPWQQNAGAAD